MRWGKVQKSNGGGYWFKVGELGGGHHLIKHFWIILAVWFPISTYDIFPFAPLKTSKNHIDCGDRCFLWRSLPAWVSSKNPLTGDANKKKTLRNDGVRIIFFGNLWAANVLGFWYIMLFFNCFNAQKNAQANFQKETSPKEISPWAHLKMKPSFIEVLKNETCFRGTRQNAQLPPPPAGIF